jgi:hypothetical protein
MTVDRHSPAAGPDRRRVGIDARSITPAETGLDVSWRR